MKLWQILPCTWTQWRKDLYSQKFSAPLPQAPIYGCSTVWPLLYALYWNSSPMDRCVFILGTSRACHPHWPLHLVALGNALLLVPEPLTTSSLMARANVIMGHLLNYDFLTFPYLFWRSCFYLWPFYLFSISFVRERAHSQGHMAMRLHSRLWG